VPLATSETVPALGAMHLNHIWQPTPAPAAPSSRLDSMQPRNPGLNGLQVKHATRCSDELDWLVPDQLPKWVNHAMDPGSGPGLGPAPAQVATPTDSSVSGWLVPNQLPDRVQSAQSAVNGAVERAKRELEQHQANVLQHLPGHSKERASKFDSAREYHVPSDEPAVLQVT